MVFQHERQFDQRRVLRIRHLAALRMEPEQIGNVVPGKLVDAVVLQHVAAIVPSRQKVVLQGWPIRQKRQKRQYGE